MNKRIIFITAGVAIGAAAGYAYYYFVGCASGTCAITSNPINSTLYGVFMGGLLGDTARDIAAKKTEKETKS